MPGAWRPFRDMPREVPVLAAVSFTVAFGLAAAVLGLAGAFGLFAPETRSGISHS